MTEADDLTYLAAWFADEMVGNEVTVSEFDPPSRFVDLVAEEMVVNERLGWPNKASAKVYLAELWPDCDAENLKERV